MRTVALLTLIGAGLYSYTDIPSTSLSAQQMKPPPVQAAEPGKTGRRVTDDGLIANYYPAAKKGPGVLVLGGSEGGLTAAMGRNAELLQAEGFSVLQLSYFRFPGQNPLLELIPLEYFATALRWLSRQPEVDEARTGILGVSRGAEAALLVATRNPQLKAVVAAMPSSVVWQGLSWEEFREIPHAWSEGGKPVPTVPGAEAPDAFSFFTNALKTAPPDTVIPVERITGEVLLTCGENDQLWPSCPMARQVETRARERKGPVVTVLAYASAGHGGFGQPLPEGDPRMPSLAGLGGTPVGNNTARADSWPKIEQFLKRRLLAR